jgi:chitinase
VCGLQNVNLAQDWDFGIWYVNPPSPRYCQRFIRQSKLIACLNRDNWARTVSPNKNVKIYLGAPASSTAAGTGYQAISTLSSVAVKMRQSFPSFGGVMLWDASQAYGMCRITQWQQPSPCSSDTSVHKLCFVPYFFLANGRYDLAIKNALSAAGGTGFSFPACSAPAYVAGSQYTGGSQVSYGGYVPYASFSSFLRQLY